MSFGDDTTNPASENPHSFIISFRAGSCGSAILLYPGVHGGDLARMYETDRGNMSRLIKALEKEGLIEVRSEKMPGMRIVAKRLYRVIQPTPHS